MAVHQFTEEQIEKLRLNPYTFSVTPNQGNYDAVPDNIAMQRMQNDLKHMRQELDFLKKLLSFGEDKK